MPQLAADVVLLCALRDAEGIDPDAGLRSVGGDSAVYRRLLGRFVEQHQRDAELLSMLLDSGHPEKARLVAHRLRGTAGTLGLTSVAEAAEAVERSPERVAELRALLESAVAKVGAALH